MGLLQPFADVIKLLIKEVVVPTRSNRFLFVVAPLLALVPAFAAWAVMSLWPGFAIADIDAGVLYVLALAGFGVYGIILAGWATNSKYAFLGAMRSAAQIVAYEIAMGFALVGVVMAAGTLNLGKHRRGTVRRAAVVVLVLAVAAVRRLLHLRRRRDEPRAVRRGGGRVGDRRRLPRRVLGHRVRDLLPRRIREHDPDLGADLDVLPRRLAVAVRGLSGARRHRWLAAPGLHWLALKIAFFLFCFLWFRATFPRYRYDQIMRLGWKVFIPVTIVWIVRRGGACGICKSGPGRR